MIRLRSLQYFMLLLALSGALFPQTFEKNYVNYPYKPGYSFDLNKSSHLQDDSELTVLGRWAWGNCHAVDVSGDYAYIGNGPTFQILDISDQSNPVLRGQYITDGYVYSIKLRDNKAFAAIGWGLLILDITDPENPEKIGEVFIGGAANNFVLEGSFAYVTTIAGMMWVVDISDVNNPYTRGRISGGGERVDCIAARNNYIYLGNPEYTPMRIVNAENPDTLTAVNFPVNGWGYSSYVKDTLLFLGIHGYSSTNYFKIFNITNPAAPEFIGQLDFQAPEDIHSITVSDNGLIAYLRSEMGKVYAVSLADLTHPQVIAGYSRKIAAGTIIEYTDIVSVQNSVFMGYITGLLILDTSEPDSLNPRSFFPTGGLSGNIKVRDSLAFVASGQAGLWIVNVSSPENPKSVANIATGGITEDMVVEDSLLYLINWAVYSPYDTALGLWIVDISDIYNPEILCHYKGNIHFSSTLAPNTITKSGNLVFITQAHSTNSNVVLEIINVSDPRAPVNVGVFESSYEAFDAAVNDTILYLATYGGGIRILNISDPQNPVEISSILNHSSGILYRQPYVFSASADFSIIDVEDPYNPFLVSSIPYGGSSIVVIEATGNFLYWSEGELGVIDISNPLHPVELTIFSGQHGGRGVTGFDDKIFYTEQAYGVWILRNNLLTDIKSKGNTEAAKDFKLYQNYPNPFNLSTVIQFSILQLEDVRIDIYNSLGEKVETILNREMQRGEYNINYNASGLASGVYFIRLITRDYSSVKKMLLLR